jgi:3-hydroxyisobutyrate dehydrogenase-like beta-hydroxyacid dehydrogenase
MKAVTKSISIIGLGPMGQAMANAFLKEGYSVTVWNRTVAKTENLASQGAQVAPTPADAIRKSDLTIISLTDYAIMYNVLDTAKEALKGKTIANLSSDTPQNVRRASEWVTRQGGKFLAGGIMVPPPLVGAEGDHVYTFYSGPADVFQQYKDDLAVLTRPDYMGSDVALAMLYYQALLDFMYTSIAGALHGYALLKSAGVPAKKLEPYFSNFLAFLPELFASSNTADEIDQRTYYGEENNMFMLVAGTMHVEQASVDAGIDSSLPKVVRQLFEVAVKKGYGKSGINSVIEAIYNEGAERSKLTAVEK